MDDYGMKMLPNEAQNTYSGKGWGCLSLRKKWSGDQEYSLHDGTKE